MTEPLKFLAEIAPTDCALQFGDDGARIEIWSKPIQADFAQAAQLVGWTRKVLRLSFFMPKDETAWVEFAASVAPLNSAIRFTKDSRVKVKFDVPQTEKLSAARLAGMADRVFRLEVAMQGEKQSSKLTKQPTPYGAFWQEMDKRGFHNRPDVRRWIECASDEGESESKARLRLALGVERRSHEASPESLLEWLGSASFMDGAITFVQDVLRSINQRTGA
jgi:hypothetical protein